LTARLRGGICLTLIGTRGNGNNDRLDAGAGDDRILDKRGRNRIKCGQGNDKVVTNHESKVAANCERVARR